MGSLVLELRKEALDSSVSTLSLLRKSLVVATKLKLHDFKDWIESEINGYKDGQRIPEYRKIRGEIKYWNQFYGWQPIIIDASYDYLSNRDMYQPVSELAQLVSNPNDRVILKYGAEADRLIMDCLEINVQPTVHISQPSIHSILDAIRDTILRWSLELEQNKILGEGMTFSEQEKESAVQLSLVINNLISANMNQNQSSSQVNQSFTAPVGAVQTGNHNIANVSQNNGANNAEILKAIAELRQQIITLPQNLQEVADDALDTLQEEIVNPTKPAKLKAAWMNICTVISKAKDPIVLVNAAFSLQEHLSKLNIDLSDIHLPHL
jgi:hypothetical protein